MAQRGKPRFEPTEEQRRNVTILVGIGVRQEDICLIIRDRWDKPISLPTLSKHFRREIDMGATALSGRIGNFMIAAILGLPPNGPDTPPEPQVVAITDEKVRGALLQLYAGGLVKNGVDTTCDPENRCAAWSTQSFRTSPPVLRRH